MKVSRYLDKLSQKLFSDPVERGDFVECLVRGESARKASIWLGKQPSMDTNSPSWQPGFVTTMVGQDREAHDRGDYYSLDLSSVFMAAVASEVVLKDAPIVDMCASPGGKSVLLWRLLAPSLVVANETIGHRIPALISNMKRCGVSPVRVTSLDSKRFSQMFPNSAALVFVDAPCSGQSLLSKGDKSTGAFHPSTINLNMNRQKRILSESAKIVPHGGHLAYSTCTFSIEENEEIVEWFVSRNPQFHTVNVEKLETFQSALTEVPCYRLFPQQGFGTGGFCALFVREEGLEIDSSVFSSLNPAWQQGEWP